MTVRASFRSVLTGVVFAATTALGCAEPELVEPRGATTAKLLKPNAAAELPASDAKAFREALGGVTIDIDRWAGYVAGTDDTALFVLHLSGSHGTKAVAGLSIAFVEGASASSVRSDLSTRLQNAASVEVRFNDGTGIVSTHSFSPSSTDAAHRATPKADTLLKRAFNDAEALLRAPESTVGSSDAEKACVANFLMTVSNAARCVDDAGNATECGAVRGNAMDTALACEGTKTANVLANTNPNVLGTRALPNLSNLSGLFSTFSSLASSGIFKQLLGGLSGGAAGGSPLTILAGLAGKSVGGNTGSLLTTATSFLPKLFGNTGLSANPLSGLVNLSGGGLGGLGDLGGISDGNIGL